MEVMEFRFLLFLALVLHLQSLFTIGILRHKPKSMETSVVMVAFKAKKKKPSHAGIVYSLERLLNHGDTLIILSVHKVKTVNILTHFPGLSSKCAEIGVKLVILSITGEDLELTICREAMNRAANHVLLDSSLKSKPRLTFYKHNISCNLTRIRGNGGLDLIRPKESSSTLWVAPKLLSNDELIDEFEFSLGVREGEKSERSLRIEHRTFESDARSSSLAYDSDDLFSIDIGRRKSLEYDSDDLFSIDIGGSPDRQTEIDVDSYSVTRSSLSGCDEGDDEVVHFTRAEVPQREFFAHMIALEAVRREDRSSHGIPHWVVEVHLGT